MLNREPPPVELNDRWFKEGAEVKSFSFDGGSGSITIYTVPAGYTFYVNSIFVMQYAVSGEKMVLKDNATTKFEMEEMTVEDDKEFFNFPCPLIFETSLVSSASAACDAWVTLSGWIEKT